jgi:ATP-dependent DNA helicase PIF1
MEKLNEKQKSILNNIVNGKNTFITGFAGSGKSYLTEFIYDILKQKGKFIALTAMTGCAALIINAKTLHSALGIGLAKGEPVDLFKRIRRMEGMLEYLSRLNVLIIDEVSMLSDTLFDKIADLFKLIHNTDKPFGKLQIILVGDMSQLKPVEGDYCFNANNWDACKIEVSILTENMRVNNDIPFHDLLTSFRWGIISNMDLIEKMKKNKFEGDIVPTKLFSKNKDVDALNQYNIGLLLKKSNESITYKVHYTDNPIKLIESTKYAVTNKIPEFLILCIGAQVMVNRNINFEEKIVNGTRGIVTSLTTTGVTIKLISGGFYNVSYFHVKPDRADDVSTKNLDFKYLPLQLSWAMSIHKSQGATVDLLEVDLGESIFTAGQLYTALSRAKNSDSVRITQFNKSSVKVSKSVIEFYNKYT